MTEAELLALKDYIEAQSHHAAQWDLNSVDHAETQRLAERKWGEFYYLVLAKGK